MFSESQDPGPGTCAGGLIRSLRERERAGDMLACVTLKVLEAAYVNPEAITEGQVQLAWMIAAQTIALGQRASHDERVYRKADTSSEAISTAKAAFDKIDNLTVPKNLGEDKK